MDVLEHRAGNSRSTKPYAAKTNILWDMGHGFASSSGIRIRLEYSIMNTYDSLLSGRLLYSGCPTPLALPSHFFNGYQPRTLSFVEPST
jgi:hypothetical protein